MIARSERIKFRIEQGQEPGFLIVLQEEPDCRSQQEATTEKFYQSRSLHFNGNNENQKNEKNHHGSAEVGLDNDEPSQNASHQGRDKKIL